MAHEVFKKYYSRLAKEGWLKALLCGFVTGLAVAAVAALVFWFVAFKEGLWVVLAILVAATAGATMVFYYARFRPTAKSIARRVDKLGLEERLVTMLELENDDSYMALKQREDTIAAVNSFSASGIRIAFASVSLVVALVVAGVFGLGTTTVSALYYADVIPSGAELLQGDPEAPLTFELSYTVASSEAGTIYYYTGSWIGLEKVDTTENKIIVEEGSDGPAVIVQPADGYSFAGWSDGVVSPYRQDLNVSGDISVVANFEEVEDVDFNDDESSSTSQTGNGEGDSDPDGPPGENSQNSDSQLPSDNDNQSAGSTGNRDEANMQVDDGQTYIGDVYDYAYEEAMGNVTSSTDLPDYVKQIVSDYYRTLDSYGDEVSDDDSDD